jgi:hypothetical protein
MSWSIELAEDIEYSNFFGYSCPLAIFRPQREFSRFVSSRRTIFKKHYLIADQIFSYAKTRFSLTLHILSFIFTSAHIVEKWRDDESFPHWLLDDAGALETVNYYSAWIFDFCPKKMTESSRSLCSQSKARSFRLLLEKPLATQKNQLETRRANIPLLFQSYLRQRQNTSSSFSPEAFLSFTCRWIECHLYDIFYICFWLLTFEWNLWGKKNVGK